MKKLYLLDANSIFYRAFYALPHFRTSKGELTNAIYGFTATLLHFLLEDEPDYIAIVFDKGKKTFRHQEYKEYKATRPKAPDELYAQIPKTKEIISAFNFPIFEEDDYEADDILGAIALKAQKENPDLKIFIVTSDRDALQLISDRISVIMPKKGFNEYEEYSADVLKEKFGLTPQQIPDYKALAGDASDNIKGIKGIGEKTAKDLLAQYGSLEGIYKNIDKIPGALRDKLIEGKSNAEFSKRMATLATDWPIKFDLKACVITDFNSQKIKEIFTDLEFKTLLARFEKFKNGTNRQLTIGI